MGDEQTTQDPAHEPVPQREINPDTGREIDPETGRDIDPATGQPVEETENGEDDAQGQ